MRLARVAAGIALASALALASSDGLHSQEKDKKAPEPEKKAASGQLPRGWDRLDLTDAQRREIARLTAEYAAKEEKLREEIRAVQAELARKRVAVLTDGQKKRLTDILTADPPDPKADPKPKGKDRDK
jgi:hypothetical protein